MPKSLGGEVRIRTHGPEKAIIHRIPTLGTVSPPVQASPRALFARFQPKAAEAPRVSVMLTADDPEFELDATISADTLDRIDVRRSSQTKNHALFEVTPRPDRSETIKTTLVFKTNHPDAKEVRIPAFFQSTGDPDVK